MNTTASNWTFVGVAYAAVWLAIGAYWLHVHRVHKLARARYDRAASKSGGPSK
jgi:hypothetical protein